MTVGVIGAGTMGQGIAQIAASAGHDVLLVDRDEAAMERALANLDRILKRLVEKGRLAPGESDEILSRIRTSSELTACAPCGLVIEAIVEKEDVKQASKYVKHRHKTALAVTTEHQISATSAFVRAVSVGDGETARRMQLVYPRLKSVDVRTHHASAEFKQVQEHLAELLPR